MGINQNHHRPTHHGKLITTNHFPMEAMKLFSLNLVVLKYDFAKLLE